MYHLQFHRRLTSLYRLYARSVLSTKDTLNTSLTEKNKIDDVTKAATDFVKRSQAPVEQADDHFMQPGMSLQEFFR